MTLTNKQIGNANQQARKVAARRLAVYKGKRVIDLTQKQQTAMLLTLLQWLGLADKSGNIK